MPLTARNKRVFLSVAILLALVSLACGVSRQLVTTLQPTIASAPVQVVPTASTLDLSNATDEDRVIADLYSRLNPSVVNITVYVNNNATLALYAEGTGFVYDDQGHVITNAHVVEGAESVEVTFSDGLIHEATTVGADLFSDLAVVKVELPQGVAPIPLGSMDDLAVGQTAIAIGNPFGFEGTLTRGVISALGRSIPSQTQYEIPQAVQTDAAINPGNSGGPLLNLAGEVIGVNDQIETNGTSAGNIGVGFAIPVSIVKRVVPALIQTGSYEWPWLGVSGTTVYPALVKAMGLPIEQGAYVVTVTENGPAQAAGLRGSTGQVTQDSRTVGIGGDVITAINGQPVKTFDDILVYLSLETSPGQQVTLTILRDGKYQDVPLQLGTRPSD